MTTKHSVRRGRQKQRLTNESVHQWYRFVLSFPDGLVNEMIDHFSIGPDDVVLDPFCGTGTTLVECKKQGIPSVGIEANPVCAIASRVKTNWKVDLRELRQAIEEVIEAAEPLCETLTPAPGPLFEDTAEMGTESDVAAIRKSLLNASREARYFVESGMLKRGWMSEIPFLKSVALLNAIKKLKVADSTTEVLLIALASTIVNAASNVSFGPEIYVSQSKDDAAVVQAFCDNAQSIVEDLHSLSDNQRETPTCVIQADARECCNAIDAVDCGGVDYVITSPPYPTEKDYTRQTRLELVFLGIVFDRKSLQTVKKALVRSHSKGIYKADNDGQWVEDVPEVVRIADELRDKVADKTYGFAKMYPRIIEEYFGGMQRHLNSLYHVLSPGGAAAYVVGDQRTYLQTFTPTADILAIIGERCGFIVEDILTWRVRKGTTGSGKKLRESILILRK